MELAFTEYLRAKTATQIVRLRTYTQYFQLRNTLSATEAVLYSLLLCVSCMFIMGVFFFASVNKHKATKVIILTHCWLSKAAHLRKICF